MPAPSSTGVGGDPHMLFPHGGKADYKGKNNTYYVTRPRREWIPQPSVRLPQRSCHYRSHNCYPLLACRRYCAAARTSPHRRLTV